MMLCDAQCECNTFGLAMLSRGKPPLCRGQDTNAANGGKGPKRQGHISKKGKAHLKDLASAGQDWRGEATYEDPAQTSSTINKLKDMLNFGKKPATEEVGAGAGATLNPKPRHIIGFLAMSPSAFRPSMIEFIGTV